MERKAYSEEMSELKKWNVDMGRMTVLAVKMAAQALLENNVDIAAQVRSLEKEVDQLYQKVDVRCISFIATQQPMARDLRFLVSSIKIATEIERIADYANNIAKKVQKKFSKDDMTPIESLKPATDLMAREAVSMLAEAMHCYEANDAELAILINERDAIVNRLNKELFRSAIAMTLVNPNSTELAMDYHTTVRYIERIADRSVKIAEFVYYEVTGDRFSDKK
jgi:phosphate transport system protein